MRINAPFESYHCFFAREAPVNLLFNTPHSTRSSSLVSINENRADRYLQGTTSLGKSAPGSPCSSVCQPTTCIGEGAEKGRHYLVRDPGERLCVSPSNAPMPHGALLQGRDAVKCLAVQPPLWANRPTAPNGRLRCQGYSAFRWPLLGQCLGRSQGLTREAGEVASG